MNLTAQEVFNKSYLGLKAQWCRSVDLVLGCAYRSPGDNGKINKCAAGQLIDDRHYEDSLEGFIVAIDENSQSPSALVRNALLKSGVGTEDIQLVRDMQQAHDCRQTMAEVMMEMAEVAKKHNLTVPN